MIHMDGERLNDGADHLREDGYRISYDQTYWTVFHGEKNRFVGGENRVSPVDQSNLLRKAIQLAKFDKERIDHLKSFAIKDFRPSHDGLLLHMPTGLLGYAEEVGPLGYTEEIPNNLFNFCCEDDGTQVILCNADDLAPACETMKAFETKWTFICEGEQYGEVNARVVGGNAEHAKATAKAATETLKYDDDRIRDRRSELSISTKGDFLAYDESYEALAKAGPNA